MLRGWDVCKFIKAYKKFHYLVKPDAHPQMINYFLQW